jgi:hypothetical protein
MQMTSVEKTVGTLAMREMALALFSSVSWRHHGIGVLQGYVVEGSRAEVRLHVWAPELVKPGMDVSGDIHDHRFDLVSHVLCGQVGHEEIIPEADDEGEWAMLKLTHARAAKEHGYHGPTEPLPGRFNIRRSSFVIEQGKTYRFPAGRFHRSPVLPGVTITCVEKHNQTDASARILHPVATPPVMAFGHEMDWKIVGPALQKAREALASDCT